MADPWDTFRAAVDPSVWLGTQPAHSQPHAAPMGNRLARIIPLLATVASLTVFAYVIWNGIQLARAPATQAVKPAALSPAAVAPGSADMIDGLPLDAFWARYKTPSAWHVVAHTADGWVYFCDGDRNGGTYWRKCGSGAHCDDTACSFATQAAVDDFYDRLLSVYHVEGAQVLNPLGYTPPPAPLGARSSWNGQRALPPGEVR